MAVVVEQIQQEAAVLVAPVGRQKLLEMVAQVVRAHQVMKILGMVNLVQMERHLAAAAAAAAAENMVLVMRMAVKAAMVLAASYAFGG